MKYRAIEASKELGINLVPVSLRGLIATAPKEVADALTNYISILHFPQDLPVFPYVVYARDKLYLVLSDHFDILPTEFTFIYQGTTDHFYFSAGEVKGTLVQTPIDKIDFGPKWTAFKSIREQFDTSTALGRLLLNLLASLAEFELELIRERVKAGMDRAARQGKKIGRPRVTDRRGFKTRYKGVLERLSAGKLSRRRASKELGIGYATLKRLLDDNFPAT